jgi:hypothetical protein
MRFHALAIGMFYDGGYTGYRGLAIRSTRRHRARRDVSVSQDKAQHMRHAASA